MPGWFDTHAKRSARASGVKAPSVSRRRVLTGGSAAVAGAWAVAAPDQRPRLRVRRLRLCERTASAARPTRSRSAAPGVVTGPGPTHTCAVDSDTGGNVCYANSRQRRVLRQQRQRVSCGTDGQVQRQRHQLHLRGRQRRPDLLPAHLWRLRRHVQQCRRQHDRLRARLRLQHAQVLLPGVRRLGDLPDRLHLHRHRQHVDVPQDLLERHPVPQDDHLQRGRRLLQLTSPARGCRPPSVLDHRGRLAQGLFRHQFPPYCCRRGLDGGPDPLGGSSACLAGLTRTQNAPLARPRLCNTASRDAVCSRAAPSWLLLGRRRC